MQWVTLEGGAKVFIDKEMCKRCKCEALIFWGITKKGKFMPVTQDENGKWISHFANCPKAKEFRRKEK